AHDRAPHSFPTRRSSDLAEEAATLQSPWSIDPLGYRLVKAGGDATDLLRRAQAQHPGDIWLNLHLGDALINSDPKEAAGYYRARSEEHTSELQSRSDLVC